MGVGADTIEQAPATTDTGIPPGYKRTDSGPIPEDWESKRLGLLARAIVRGASPRPIDSPRWFDQNSPIGWVRIADVSASSRYLTATTQQLSEGGVASSRFVPTGSLIMSICATVGRPIETRLDVCIHDGFVVFVHPRVEQGFLYHVLAMLEPTWVRRGQTGSQMNLNTSIIKITPVAVPPRPEEQQAIAEALSDVDGLIGALEALIGKKRAIKQAAMQQLLTAKTRLPGFTSEWQKNQLGELFGFSGGVTASRAQLSDEGHCYLHYGDIHGSDKQFVDVKAEFQNIPKLKLDLARVPGKALLADGDVVFVDASEDDEGTSKHVVVVNPEATPYISGLHTILAKAKTDELAHAYRRFCFQTHKIKQQFRFYAVGTKVSGISKTNIAKILIEYPDKDEQEAIATVLSDMDAEIAALEQRLNKTRDIKQGMMQQLLTGRIRLIKPKGAGDE